MSDRPTVLLTCAGKRYDIVAAFGQHARTVVTDRNPLAPAQYAADERRVVAPVDAPEYLDELRALCEELDVGGVLPLTDLDIETLARSDLPAFVPPPETAARTFDKLETHQLLTELGLPAAPTWLPDELPDELAFPVVVKPRRGSGSRSIAFARDRSELEFFVGYSDEPVVVQRAMGGHEYSVDVLCDRDGRCINSIPRTMVESKGGESIKGMTFADPELIALGRAVAEAIRARGPCMVQCFRDPEIGIGITDLNPRFGGGFPALMYGGGSYPELISRMAAGERVEPRVGEFEAGRWFARWNWHIELTGPAGDDHLPAGPLTPTGRDFIPGGPPDPTP